MRLCFPRDRANASAFLAYTFQSPTQMLCRRSQRFSATHWSATLVAIYQKFLNQCKRSASFTFDLEKKIFTTIATEIKTAHACQSMCARAMQLLETLLRGTYIWVSKMECRIQQKVDNRKLRGDSKTTYEISNKYRAQEHVVAFYLIEFVQSA